jgi:hypothetical protein
MCGRILFAAFVALTLALICTGWPSGAFAGEVNFSPAGGSFIQADWQDPSALPPRFRNHCSFDLNHGVSYCANHCGIDYQFYYCTAASFGCCHRGRGYCDWDGFLRCAP